MGPRERVREECPMTMRSARELARRYDEMLGAIEDGRDNGDQFEAWLARYRRDGTPARPTAPPTAVSQSNGDPQAVEWWQLGDTVLGIPTSGDNHYHLPLADLIDMPTAKEGFATD